MKEETKNVVNIYILFRSFWIKIYNTLYYVLQNYLLK